MFALTMRGRPLLESLVIANYITLTTDSETSIHRVKCNDLLFVKLSQERYIIKCLCWLVYFKISNTLGKYLNTYIFNF